MIFLIVYDRREQKMLQPLEEFESRPEARRRRLEVQLALPPVAGRYEVVLLEADNLETIKLTHARYFYSTEELARAGAADAAELHRRLAEGQR